MLGANVAKGEKALRDMLDAYKGNDSDSCFNHLRKGKALDPSRDLKTIQRYHIEASEQWRLLRSTKCDPPTLDDVCRALPLMLGKLLRAGDISSIDRARRREADTRVRSISNRITPMQKGLP
jgi:hypothetical protein